MSIFSGIASRLGRIFRSGSPATGMPTVSTPRGQIRILEERINSIVAGLGGQYEVLLPLSTAPRKPYKTVGRKSALRRAGEWVRHVTRTSGLPSNADVLGWFVAGTARQPARNILDVTQGMRQEIVDEVERAFYTRASGGSVPSIEQLKFPIANAYKRFVLNRFESGGGDLNLAPLSPAWRARKLRLGYPAKIGTASGQLVTAIRKATPVVRRVR